MSRRNSRVKNRHFVRLACTAIALIGCNVHAEIGPPQKPDLTDAPAHMRSFLTAARKADRIKDPLKRCLAYPDYPGNHWPKGLAKVYCHYRLDPHITQADIRHAVRKGRLHALDKRFAADLAKHFSNADFSPVIHRDYETIHAAKEKHELHEWDTLTRDWLKADPHSAFALTARGEYFRALARVARGGKWGSETPDENMRHAVSHANKAIGLYRKALAIEPRMLPAYVSMLGLGRMTGNHAWVQQAIDKGTRLDPACKVLTSEAMITLEPRWGGNYGLMLALKSQLEKSIGQRPLLALNTIMPREDFAEELFMSKNYRQAYAAIQPALLQSVDPNSFELAARILSKMDKPQPWKQLEYLLEASRFRPGDSYVSYTRGLLIFQLTADYAWSIPSLIVGVQADPDDPWGHYFLGTAYGNTRHYDKARHELIIASENNVTRGQALLGLVGIAMNQQQPGEARRYIDTFSKDYPDDARGWYFRGYILLQLHDVAAAKTAFKTFIKKADRSDVDQIQYLRATRRLLHDLDTDPQHARYIH